MVLTLQRLRSTRFDTTGRLFIDGRPVCSTLEDAMRKGKLPGRTCIPCGTYRLSLRFSPRFTPRYGHPMLWVRNVPGFAYVLIHCGNSHADTAGCILIGTEVTLRPDAPSTLTESRKAYDEVYPRIAGAVRQEEVVLTIHDPE